METTREAGFALQPAGLASSLKARRKLIAVMISAAWAVAGSSAALAVTMETENNDTFPGQASIAGETYFGSVGGPDSIDFYGFLGLTPGSPYDLTGTSTFADFDLVFGVYTDQTTTLATLNIPPGLFGALIGVVPASGELTFGVTSPSSRFGEGYELVLNVTRQVPEPATLALLAAGLAGGFVARRRKRA